jgi:hypothetical protein
MIGEHKKLSEEWRADPLRGQHPGKPMTTITIHDLTLTELIEALKSHVTGHTGDLASKVRIPVPVPSDPNGHPVQKKDHSTSFSELRVPEGDPHGYPDP